MVEEDIVVASSLSCRVGSFQISFPFQIRSWVYKLKPIYVLVHWAL